jgi:hypothetical protein
MRGFIKKGRFEYLPFLFSKRIRTGRNRETEDRLIASALMP